MIAETKRLLITGFTSSMAESVHKNSLDDDNRRFVPDEVFETIGAAKEAIDVIISFYGKAKSKKPQIYAVILKESGQQIGHVQAVPIGEEWEIGYHIGNEFTGNGYATEAVKAFLPEIMQRLDICQIYGICHGENAASKKVLENCGFKLISQRADNMTYSCRVDCDML